MLAAMAPGSQHGNGGLSTSDAPLDAVRSAAENSMTIFGKFELFGTARFSVFILYKNDVVRAAPGVAGVARSLDLGPSKGVAS